ncbi:DUF354 domain-containing protein [Candidatus Poribacteria bacterium]
MKIWIDLSNSPHVNFFAGMINELRKEHDVLLTGRQFANTIGLLELYGFPYHLVGKHYGKNIVKKVLGFMVRTWQLFFLLKRENIDVAISQSSFFSPLVAKLLGVKSIYLNDNEHAEGNRISFIFANKIMIPEFLDIKAVQKQWARKEKVIKYPGVKEGVYLWYHKPSSSSSFRIDIKGDEDRKVIFIRSEPWVGQYYKGERNSIDDLLIELKDDYKVVLLPRSKPQEEYYRQSRFAGVHVLGKSIALADVMRNCDLFIGAGGTMTREAAVLGIPTISIYQDQLLQVDEYLIKTGLMAHNRNPDIRFVNSFLKETERKPPSKQLLDKGKQAYELIRETLLDLAADKSINPNPGSKEEDQVNA